MVLKLTFIYQSVWSDLVVQGRPKKGPETSPQGLCCAPQVSLRFCAYHAFRCFVSIALSFQNITKLVEKAHGFSTSNRVTVSSGL